MNDGKEQVRATLAAEEEIELPEDMAGGMDMGQADDPGTDPGDPGAGPDDGSPAPPDGVPGPDQDAARAAAAHPLNDYGNGQRFVVYFGGDVLWVPRVGFFVWTGSRWKKDADEIEARRRAQEIGALIQAEIQWLVLDDWQMAQLAEGRELRHRDRDLMAIVARGGDDAAAAQVERDAIGPRLARAAGLEKLLASKKREHRSFARTAGNTTRISAAMTEAQVALARELALLDAGVLDVNCESGVLRFAVEGGPGTGMPRMSSVQLLPHDRAFYATKLMPVIYDPTATAPLFDAFLHQIQPDPAMRAFLQRWFGLNMTALTGEQKLCFFHGEGGNGKSVIVDVIARIMGDYAATAKIESLTGRNRRGGGDATPDLVPLMGARMVRASEPEEGEKLQEGLIKELTGGEPLLIRALHSDFVEVKPIFKLTISGNHKPEIRGLDEGIWRRVLLVPFDVQIPKAARDQHLAEKLWAERAGIFKWLVDGLLDYLEGGLQEPAAVLDATQEYREESDPVGLYLDSACVITGDHIDTLHAKDLVQGFNYWLAEQGQTAWKDMTVFRRLKQKARAWRSFTTGKSYVERKSNGLMRYDGIKFSDTFARDLPKDSATGRIVWPKRRDV